MGCRKISVISLFIFVTGLSGQGFGCPALMTIVPDPNAPVNVGQTVTFTAQCDSPIQEYEWIFPAQAYSIGGQGTGQSSCKFSPASDAMGYQVQLRFKFNGNWYGCSPVTVIVNSVSGPWYVRSDGNDQEDGRTWETAFQRIQTAIGSASTGDEIIVEEGLYPEHLSLEGKDIEIHSTDPNNGAIVGNTILQGDGQGAVVFFEGTETADCLLRGFTVAGGGLSEESLDPNLDARWGLDELSGTSVPDSSGNEGRNGEFKPDGYGPEWDPDNGKIAGCLSFDGGDYVEMSDYYGIGGTCARTTCAWIYVSSAGTTRNILSYGGSAYRGSWLFMVNADNKLQLGVNNGNIIGNPVLMSGCWYHVAAVLDDWNRDGLKVNDLRLYINGKQITGNYSNPNEALNTGGTYPVRIGTHVSVSYFFNGRIDEVRLYSRALTEAEIRAVYSQGGGICGNGTGASISQCIIQDNDNGLDGGGFWNVDGEITDCFILRNQSQSGGGGLADCDGLIANCLIAENEAAWGGALGLCAAEIVNCTMVSNTAETGGVLDTCPVSITNCILWNNTGTLLADCNTPTYSCYPGASGDNNLSADPVFRSLSDLIGPDEIWGTEDDGLILQGPSPCIDAGTDPAVPSSITKDITGRNRFLDGNHDQTATVDMGAYETPRIWYVDGDAAPGGDGKSWAAAKKTIQDGIDASQDGDVVLVADGIYTGGGYTGSRNRDLDFGGKAITVRSLNGPENCIIDCNGLPEEPHRGFYFDSDEGPDSVLSGFTIQDGYAKAKEGFPVISESNGNASAGGIGCDESCPTIQNCILKRNTATRYGGGLFAGDGSKPTIYNTLFIENTADDSGGAVFSKGGNSHSLFVNCDFFANEPDTLAQYSAQNTVINSIILVEVEGTKYDEISQGTIIEYSFINCGWSGPGNIGPGYDPNEIFVDLANGNLRLVAGSPCIDAGTNLTDPPLLYSDLDGNPRRIDDPDTQDTGYGYSPLADMGAYEYRPPADSNNNPPQVNAGSDKIVKLYDWLDLSDAAASDEEPLTLAWTKTAGPRRGHVLFDPNDQTMHPKVWFSEPNQYTLELQADDGEFYAADTLAVTVVRVSAGLSQTIRLPRTAHLDAAIDGAAPASVQWKVVSQYSDANDVTFSEYSASDYDADASFTQPGTYVLRITAEFAGFEGTPLSDETIVTVLHDTVNPVNNDAPAVRAWADPNTISWPANTTYLVAQVSDDGLPDGRLSVQWKPGYSTASGTVAFGTYSAAEPNAAVTFSHPGTYELLLAADDGSKQTTRPILVTVLPPETPEGNGQPVISAGGDRTIPRSPCSPFTITLDSSVVDPTPTGYLSIQWTVIEGPQGGLGISSPAAAQPQVTFFQPGTWTLLMTVSDGQYTVTDQATITVTTAPLTPALQVNAGPDTLLILPADGHVIHTLSGLCQSDSPGLYDYTEWEVAVEPNESNLETDPVLPAASVLDPNLIFSVPGDYVFRLVAKDSGGMEVESDEVYIKVKPADQQFTTYLYLYDLDEAGKRKWEEDKEKPWGSCPPANLVFSSYENGTKLVYQRVDPINGPLQMVDVGRLSDPNMDPNIFDISQAKPMLKGQYIYVDGEDSVYKVTSSNNRFSVLAGDVKRDSTSGYFIIGKNGFGVDTEFYSHIHGFRNDARRYVIFAYENNTHVTVQYEYVNDESGTVEDSDPILLMEKYNPETFTYDNAEMDNFEMSAGDHVSLVPEGRDCWIVKHGEWFLVRFPVPIYIHVMTDKPVSIEMCNDSGFYVPSSDGLWTGKVFNAFVDTYFDDDPYSETFGYYITGSLSISAYENDTKVVIRTADYNQEKSLRWGGTLHEGENFIYPVGTLDNIEDIEQNSYLKIESLKPISVAVRRNSGFANYAHGDFIPDRKGGGTGIDLIGYCVEDSLRYFTILSHNDNTRFSVYDPYSWEPIIFDSNDIYVELNAGQYFSAENYLDDTDKHWRVFSTKPVTISSGANRAFAEYAPLAGIQSSVPEIRIVARTEKGYPDQSNDPNVYPLYADWDEITYTIFYWNPDENPDVYGQKIVDELPDQIDHDSVQFTGPNGTYDPNTNTLIWDIGTLLSGQGENDPCTVAVTVKVNQWPKNGNKIFNRVRIENIENVHATLPVFTQVNMMSRPSVGDIIYVNAHANGMNNGSSWQDAFNNLQTALSTARELGSPRVKEIWVAKGIYFPGPVESSSFQMVDGVDVYGGFSGKESTLHERDLQDPNNHTILTGYTTNEYVVTAANSIIDGFTISWGHHGILCEGTSPTIKNCIIEDNCYYNIKDLVGYGIECYNGSPVISNNIITKNARGGIYCSHTNATIINNLIVDNWTGILLENYTSDTIRGNTIVNNRCYGIRDTTSNCNDDIDNCTVWGKGDCDFEVFSGIEKNELNYCYYSDPNLADPNAASHSVFENYYLYYEINNIESHTATDPNKIVVFHGKIFKTGDIIEIQNDGILRTIIEVSEGSQYDTVGFSPPYYKEIPYMASIYKWGTETTSVVEDYHLKEGSPCVDAGDPAFDPPWDEVDIDGQPRLMGSQVDIGADEYSSYIVYAGKDKYLSPGESAWMEDAYIWPDNSSWTLTWQLLSAPAGSAYPLNQPLTTALNPIFELDALGTYQFRLSVYEGTKLVGADTLNVLVGLSVDADTAAPYEATLAYDPSYGLCSASVELVGRIRGADPEQIQILWGDPDYAVSYDPTLWSQGDSLYASQIITFYKAGTYEIPLEVFDLWGRLLASDTAVVTIHAPAFEVDAGPSRQIDWTDPSVTIQLYGKVIGYPLDQVDLHWRQISGPDEVVFDPALDGDIPRSGIFDPNVTFPRPGLYEFQFVADHGFERRVDSLQILVGSGVLLSAGEDLYGQLINGQANVTTGHAYVYPDDGSLTIQWYCDGQIVNGADRPNGSFRFYTSGDYELTLQVSDQTQEWSDSIMVHIYELPSGDPGQSLYINPGRYQPVVLENGYAHLWLNGAFYHAQTSQVLFCRWSLAAGPDNAEFVQSSDGGQTSTILNPDVIFTEDDTYWLKLEVLNSQDIVIGSAQTCVLVLPEGSDAPTSGPDQTPPVVQISAVQDGADITDQTLTHGRIDITARAVDTGSGIYGVQLSLDNIPLTCVYGTPHFPANLDLDYTLDVVGLSRASHTLKAETQDGKGNYNSTELVFDVNVPTTGQPPIAAILNLDPNLIDEGTAYKYKQLPVIETGFFELHGIAWHPEISDQNLRYKLDLYGQSGQSNTSNDWNYVGPVRIAGKTWQADGFYHGQVPPDPNYFGQIDLTGFENGVYQLQLTVQVPGPYGDWISSTDSAQFVLDCPLKIGQVKFTQEDLVIPVGGLPLRILRTYNSFQRHQDGPFGCGWTYTIAGMDIELNEQRIPMPLFEDPDQTYSIRVSDNFDRNVTLTLPDGQKATFQFYLEYDPGYMGQLGYYVAKYQSPLGVTDTLETYPQERFEVSVGGDGFGGQWNGQGGDVQGMQDPAHYDFSEYRLTTADGTQYFFERQDYGFSGGGEIFGTNIYQTYFVNPRGDLYLSKIQSPSGETIDFNVDPSNCQIGPQGIEHQYFNGTVTTVTKAVKIVYDAKDRISEIYAPAEQGLAIPTIYYEYDNFDNLAKVHKLVDKTKTEPNDRYETITYLYEDEDQGHTPADHYITGILDPRGIQPIRYLYDDAGRLIATQDANGNTIQLGHDGFDPDNGRYEEVTDRSGNTSRYFYDPRGNVTLVQKFDSFGVVIDSTRYEYDPNSPFGPDRPTLTAAPHRLVDGLIEESVTRYKYEYYTDPGEEGYGSLHIETVIDPNNNLTQTYYDPRGNVTQVVQGKNAEDWDTFEELTTSHTKYTDTNLPYLTGITTGSGQDLLWHTLSVTWYGDNNRITYTAQVNTDAVSYEDLIDGGNLKPFDAAMQALLAGSPVTSYVYNEHWSGSPDQPYAVIDPAGGEQYFHYDRNNAQDASWTFWDDPADADILPDKFVMNLAVTDDQGRPLQSYRLVDEVADPEHKDPNVPDLYADLSGLIAAGKAVLQGTTIYNAIGQADRTIDPHGVTTQYEYDALGQLVQTLVYESENACDAHYPGYPADTAGLLSISQTLYDVDGRAIVSVGPRDPNNPILPTGSETVYDPLGRVTQTRRWPQVQITMADLTDTYGNLVGRKAAGWTTEGAAPVEGNELSYTRTEYDLAGRVWRTYTQNEEGDEICTAEFEYDLSGRQIRTLSLPGTDDQTVTETLYEGTQRTAVIDARNNVTEFVYDDLGRAITTILPPSVVIGGGEDPNYTYTHTGYDALGRKVWQTEPTTKSNQPQDQIDYDTVKVFEYDAAGQLSAVVLPKVQDPNNGFNWTWPRYEYEYDSSGNLILIRDKVQQLASPFSASPTAAYTFSRETSFTYDEQGRQTSRTLPDGRTEYKTYDTYGRLQVELDFKEQATGYFYDAQGRLEYRYYYPQDSSVGDGVNDNYPDDYAERIGYTWDNLGRKRTETHTTYDAAQQPVESRQWSYAYDIDGNLTRIQSPEGILNYQYSPITGSKVRTWTGDSWETRITDTTCEYDDLGRLETVTVWRRDGQDLSTPETTTYTYNDAGSRQSIELPNDVYTEYTYDPLNRLTNLTNYQSDQKAATISSFTYSLYANSMRAGVNETVQENHTVAYDYDTLNRLTQETNYNSQNYGYTSDYIYDLVGNRYQRQVEVTNHEDTYTLTTTYVYNEHNDQLMREVHTGPEFAFLWNNQPVYAYAAGGRLSYQLPGKEGWLNTMQAFWLGMPTPWDHIILMVLLIGLPIVFLMPSLRRFYRRLAGHSPPDTKSLSLYHRSLCLLFVYIFLLSPDCLDMLARADGQYLNLSASSWGSGNRTISYLYDANGSQIRKTTKKTLEEEIIEVVEYEYNLQNRLSKAVTTTYSQGQPVDTETVEYRYDPAGIRTEKVIDNTTRIEYLVDPENHTGYAQVLEESEYDITNPPSPVLLSTLYYTIGDDVISQTKAADFGSGWTLGDTEYLLYDGHGSTRQLTLPNKSVIDNYCYDGYGVMLGSTGSVADNAKTSMLYTGEQFDANLDQYYLRARYYNQNNGTFNRIDPYSGNKQDPQSLHKYLYCHANPINAIDPSGFGLNLPEVLMTIAIIAVIVNVGVTVYNGVRKNTSGLTIAWQVIQNISMFLAIMGTIFLSGPIAIAAGLMILIASILGIINLVRNWPNMDTTDKVVAAVTILTYIVFAASLSIGASLQSEATTGSQATGGSSLEPQSYFGKNIVDMRNAPTSSATNAAGFPRNAPWFWRQIYKTNPEYFSSENVARITDSSPRSPKVDSQWIKFHPEHKAFMGDTLIHHHINQGPFATPLPSSVHIGWGQVLHTGYTGAD